MYYCCCSSAWWHIRTLIEYHKIHSVCQPTSWKELQQLQYICQDVYTWGMESRRMKRKPKNILEWWGFAVGLWGWRFKQACYSMSFSPSRFVNLQLTNIPGRLTGSVSLCVGYSWSVSMVISYCLYLTLISPAAFTHSRTLIRPCMEIEDDNTRTTSN